MSERKFLELYKKLNTKQKQAVDTIEGPVMVIAGPGTGKTSILTMRIANILQKTDTLPESILALTFTESGVRAMRQKLLSIIGPRAYRVYISTFHSLANDIIKTYPEKFPRIIGSEHVENLEQIRLVEEILETGQFKHLRPKGEPGYYVEKIISAIKDLKRDDLTAKKLADFLASQKKSITRSSSFRHKGGKYKGEIKGEYREKLHKIERTGELARVFNLYEKALAKVRLYDFEDMILEVLRRLQNDRDLLLELQEKYQYILADEHQDANYAQNRLLELLSSFFDNPNLFVVGDEKQAIFRFQGASIENFLYFKQKFPKAEVIVLSENYRSQQMILDAAHSLIVYNKIDDSKLRLKLSAKADHPLDKVSVIEALDKISEVNFVIDRVNSLIKSGVSLKEIAILIRDNKHADLIEHQFRTGGIPLARFTQGNALNHPYIESLLNLIRVAQNPTDGELLAKIAFAPFFEIDAISIAKIIAGRKRNQSLIETFREHKTTEPIFNLISHLARLVKTEPLAEGFELLIKESGFEKFILGHKASRKLLPLYDALSDAILRHAERNKKATLADFITRLDRAVEYGHSILSLTTAEDGVVLLTAHGSKGLEFDHVFIIHGNDGIWGGRKDRHYFLLPTANLSDPDVDERRLFYVALTRARKSVTISYSLNEEGREKSPSRFIDEIDENHKTHIKVKTLLQLKKSVSRPKGDLSLLGDKKYLRTLFLTRGFSVTHLNNFLRCPWHYFFVDLLRVPKRQDNSALYGLAIHSALTNFFDAYARGEDITVKKTGELFENYLWRSSMSARDFKENASDGRKEIMAYLNYHKFSRSIWNEFKVSGVPFKVGDTEINLTGMLDKVELLSSGKVNVVDYKTGRPRSRKEIEGLTKDGDGNYLRQLIFYRLLLDHYKKGEWRMETGTIDFIKPDQKGRFHREVFAINNQMVKDLEVVIQGALRRIWSFSFRDETCDEKDCEYCSIARLLDLV